MAPWLVGFLVLVAGPMVASIGIALTSWDLLRPPKFIGFDNFVRMWNDNLFWMSLVNTAYYTFIGVPLHLMAALVVALSLNAGRRGTNILRTAFYVPSITPAVASALLWYYILNADFGLANAALRLVGLPTVGWLTNPAAAKPALILMGLWSIGPAMVIFLAGLQSVPDALYEAASLDGAGSWARFRHVTLPLISPVVFFNLVLGIINSFQVFTQAFIMTDGGPEDATLFLVLLIYRHAFQFLRMGYAATLAWALFAIVLFFTIIQFRVANRWVYYESAPRE
jgi:multiple sugar transport system permease protein